MKVAWGIGTTCTIVAGVCEQHESAENVTAEHEKFSYRFEVGHLGESMAYSILLDGSLIPITQPHTPINNAERERVEKLGGYTVIQTSSSPDSKSAEQATERVTLTEKDKIEEESLPTFEPGHTKVSRCLGGKKRKQSIYPPFLIAEPEMFTIASDVEVATTTSEAKANKKVLGVILCTDGVYSYRGARLQRIGVEGKIKPIVLDMIDQFQTQEGLASEDKARITRKASKDISRLVALASKDEQAKLGHGDNISVATMLVSHVLLGL